MSTTRITGIAVRPSIASVSVLVSIDAGGGQRYVATKHYSRAEALDLAMRLIQGVRDVETMAESGTVRCANLQPGSDYYCRLERGHEGECK